ncbi:MAG: polymer-forming cytoskeletal protein [Thiobacillus sp.]|jgi:cytoskeletal protein CcmA (bactofilin family)|nr:polymer-forming cytoskeletal protein [Thiobacillus sp.]
MLKNFMHSPPSQADSKLPSLTRTESSRFHHSSNDALRPAEAAKPESAAAADTPEDGNKLIVGPNIKLKGSEITDCEILVVEGRVEASMNSRDIRIAEGGVFSGKAEIDVAEVRGTFEGELTARKRLVVYATGRVSGTIHYGALMVEEGGSITGNMAMHTPDTRVSKVTELPSQSAATESSQPDTSSLELARNAAGKR